MISSVFVSGRLGKKTGGYRYVEVDRSVPNADGHYETDHFLVRPSTGEDSSFMTLPLGSYICFKGRLEQDEERGLIIVDEIDEIYRPGSGKETN